MGPNKIQLTCVCSDMNMIFYVWVEAAVCVQGGTDWDMRQTTPTLAVASITEY